MLTRLTTEQIALGSVGVAIGVLALKLLAWRLTGSVALFSDALETLVNVGGAVIAWGAVRYASRPPDAEHPFGHHKAEYMSAVAEGIMILIAAFWIVEQSVQALRMLAEPQDWGWPGLVVNALAMFINLAWARVLLSRGAALRSPALVAGGRHLLSDVWTSVAVLMGLVLAMLTGWAVLDPLLALVVAANILREGFMVIRSSLNGLMDTAATQEEQRRIAEIIHQTAEGALQIHGIKTRRSGAALFVEFHMVVAGMMTVCTAHDICDRIEEAIQAALPDAQVNIHVEPEHKLEKTGIQPR